jgi:c-di-GMP-binding flagellar brake protein YcgR
VVEVVRCNEIRLNWEKGAGFTIAMKFLHIDEKDCEAIISFIFCEQRNKLQAGIAKRNNKTSL